MLDTMEVGADLERCTGLGYGTMYYVFFDDANFFGGAVVYQVTTVKEQAIETAGRLFVGSIVTPKSGGVDTVGNNDGGSGAQNGRNTILSPSVYNVGLLGNGSVSNPQNAVDGDQTTYATLTATGNNANNTANIALEGPPGINRGYQSATLKIRRAVPTNSVPLNALHQVYQIEYWTNGFGNGTPTSVETLTAGGGTLPINTVSVPLPLGLNLSQLAVNFTINTNVGDLSGTVQGQLNEAWIEVVE